MSLWFPTWSTDLIRRRLRRERSLSVRKHEARLTVILTQQQGGREIVVRRCAQGAVLGVAPGMDLAHARSLLPSNVRLWTEPHRPDIDAAALRAVARMTLAYSPMIAADMPDSLMIDASGLAHIYGTAGERGLIEAVAAKMTQLGFSIRAAIASSFASAWGLARFGKDCFTCVPLGDDRAALAALPIEALRIDSSTTAALREIGLVKLEHIFDLPRAELASRFGDELLYRLDCVLGAASETVEFVHSESPVQAELIFDGPSDRWEAVEAATRHVFDTVIGKLIADGLCTRQLNLEVQRPQGRLERISLPLSHASRDRKHLWPLVVALIERIDLSNGVEGIMITVPRPERFKFNQNIFGSFGDIEAPADDTAWGELTDNLVSQVGSSNVVQFELVESHLPERAVREHSVMERIAAKNSAAITPADRPTRLFQPPRPARVLALTPDGPILSVACDGCDQRIVTCVGPERIGPEWWRWQATADRTGPPPDRDYFAVQTEEGTWLWVCRQVGAGQWFVHGDWA